MTIMAFRFVRISLMKITVSHDKRKGSYFYAFFNLITSSQLIIPNRSGLISLFDLVVTVYLLVMIVLDP